MSALAQLRSGLVPVARIEVLRPLTTEERLAAELAEARAQNARLLEMLGEQATHVVARLGQLADAAPKKPTITIGELFEKFEELHRGDYSWIVIRNRMRPLVRRLGALPACDLTSVVWAEHRLARLKEPFRVASKGPLYPSVRTINHELHKAKQLLYFAVNGGLLDRNPLAGVRPEKCRRHRETFLDETTLRSLLLKLSPLMQAFVLVCAEGALRFNECRRLQRDWISADGVIRLPARITKSRRSRPVGLTERVQQALARIPQEEDSPHFFVNRRRRRGQAEKAVGLISERTLRRWFREACLEAGVDAKVADGDVRLRVHDLRHTAATAAMRRGATLPAVQRLLGHSSCEITSRYLHADDSEVAGIARLMERGAATEAEKVPEMQSISAVVGRRDGRAA